MAGDFKKGPNAVHPETASAVGSRNSLNRDGRDEYVESRLIVDEEVDKLMNHIQSKLPPEVLQDLQVMGNIKSNLHTYYNSSFQNMLNRYLTTAEDELAKKVRDMIDKEENQTLNRYTPREVAALVNQIGGPEVFNTGEVEKSVVNIMGHLQGHVQRGTYEFESMTNGLLLQHTDVGSFIRGDNAYAVVKCTFRNNYKKPEEVFDIKLAINVLDSEMISPIISHQKMTLDVIKDVVSGQLTALIDKEIEEINQQLQLEGRPELSPNEMIFEKIKAIENYTEDDESENSKRYQLLPKYFMDRLKGMTAEAEKTEHDPLKVRESIQRLLDHNHLRTRGWNTAVNSITAILDTSRMGYQFAQNFKHARQLQIREYEETDSTLLPDERYTINLKYYDARQIREEKVAYSAQVSEFQREVMRLWDVVEAIYKEEKAKQGWKDWQDLMGETLDRNKRKPRRGWFSPASEEAPAEEGAKRVWNEITFVQRPLTTLEEMNQTYEMLVTEFKERFIVVRRRLDEVFELRFPDHRTLVEERLNFLESQFMEFMGRVNPYHVQPGLLLEVSITTIRRLRATVKGMSNVLNEYLSGISKGFSDRAMKEPGHRRSNVTEGLGDFTTAGAEH
jgi:hypothetical protein